MPIGMPGIVLQKLGPKYKSGIRHAHRHTGGAPILQPVWHLWPAFELYLRKDHQENQLSFPSLNYRKVKKLRTDFRNGPKTKTYRTETNKP